MRRFNVRIEGTDFVLDVEEYKTVPVIASSSASKAWAASGQHKIMNQYSR